jgi:hypothetical protein
MRPDELVAHIQAAIDRGHPDMVEILSHLTQAAKCRALADEQRQRGAHALAAKLTARAETYLSNARLVAYQGPCQPGPTRIGSPTATCDAPLLQPSV